MERFRLTGHDRGRTRNVTQLTPMALETHEVQCPYCWETIELDVETMVEDQTFIEDCTVCCHPIEYTVSTDDDDNIVVNPVRSD